MWLTDKYCNGRQALLRASDSPVVETLKITLSEEIMGEMDNACPLDIEFPLSMHFGGPNPEKRGLATTPLMSAHGHLHYWE